MLFSSLKLEIRKQKRLFYRLKFEKHFYLHLINYMYIL